MTKQSQSAPIGGWGRRNLGNGSLRLPHARRGTKPISDHDPGGYAPLYTVYDAELGLNPEVVDSANTMCCHRRAQDFGPTVGWMKKRGAPRRFYAWDEWGAARGS